MKKIVLIITMLVSINSHGDIQVDCDKEEMKRWEVFHCERETNADLKQKYLQRYNELVEQITARKNEIDIIGWGVSSEFAINNIKKSHELWEQVISIDCGLYARSPRNAGSKNPEEQDCETDSYKIRLGQLNKIAEYWLQ